MSFSGMPQVTKRLPASGALRRFENRRRLAICLFSLLALVDAGAAVAQNTVHVEGTVSWPAASVWPVSSAVVSDGDIQSSVVLGPDGKSGTYDLLAPVNSTLSLSAQISTCSTAPCPASVPGATIMYPGVSVVTGTADVEVDMALPPSYSLSEVIGTVGLVPGSPLTIVGGSVQIQSFDPITGTSYTVLTLLEPSWIYSALVGVGTATQLVQADVVPCLSPLLASSSFDVPAGGPVSVSTVLSAPVANAGPDQTVNEGALVSLDGSSSSCSQSFVWSQLAGPSVTLSDPAAAMPTFVAPTLPTGPQGNQTLTFQLVASALGALSVDTVDITVRHTNHTPVADAGPDQTVAEGSPVGLNGLLSYDPDGDPLSYQWLQIGGPPVVLAGADTAQPSFNAPLQSGGVGEPVIFSFQLTVSDGLLSAVDQVQVTVEQQDHPPIAIAGPDQSVRGGQTVTLDGTQSTDPDGDALTYTWRQILGPPVVLSDPTIPMPNFTAPTLASRGVLAFELTVSDGVDSNSDTVSINDLKVGAPPVCSSAYASKPLLWPPNHKLIRVRILGVVGHNSDDMPVTVTGATSDEPVSGLGDGDTSPDAILQGKNLLLRAERANGGNGRVYVVSFIATNRRGGSCTGSVPVSVPVKHRTPAINDGQLYDATLR